MNQPKLTPADGKLDPIQFLLDHRNCMAPGCLNHTSVVLMLRGKPMAYCESCSGISTANISKLK